MCGGREAWRVCWKQGGRQGWRGNLRPQREAGVGELMRALVCVHKSTVLVWIPRVDEMTVDQSLDCPNRRQILLVELTG